MNPNVETQYFASENMQDGTQNFVSLQLQQTPDPGNAGVGRGNKLSVLRIRPDAEMV